MQVEPAGMQLDAGEKRAQHGPQLGRRKLRPAAREPRGAVQQPALPGGLGHGGTQRREHFRFIGDEAPHALCHEALQVSGRDAHAERSRIPAANDQGFGHVIAVTPATLVRVARGHALAAAAGYTLADRLIRSNWFCRVGIF